MNEQPGDRTAVHITAMAILHYNNTAATKIGRSDDDDDNDKAVNDDNVDDDDENDKDDDNDDHDYQCRLGRKRQIMIHRLINKTGNLNGK